MSASISLQQVAEADLPTLADFLCHSKLSLVINRVLWKDWPNTDRQRANYAKAIDSTFGVPDFDFVKAVDETTQEIVGFLTLSQKEKASEPKDDAANDEEDSAPKVPDGVYPEVLQVVGKAIRDVEEFKQELDHVDVKYVYVRPSSRKLGVGRKLLEYGLDKARDKNLPLVAAVEPEAHGFFVKFDFKDTRHADIDLAQWAPANCGLGTFRLSGMIRQA